MWKFLNQSTDQNKHSVRLKSVWLCHSKHIYSYWTWKSPSKINEWLKTILNVKMRRSYSGFSLFAIKSIYFMKNNIIYGKSPYSTLNLIDLYPLLALTKQKTKCLDVVYRLEEKMSLNIWHQKYIFEYFESMLFYKILKLELIWPWMTKVDLWIA